MTYLLATAVGLVMVMAFAILMLLYLATRDVTSGVDNNDDDEEVDLLVNVEPYVSFFPPFRILYLGESGEHDEYPITPEFRKSFVDYLEASWTLPTRGRCPICWSPVDGNQCHLHNDGAAL